MYDILMLIFPSVRSHLHTILCLCHLRLLCTSRHDTPAAVWPSCLYTWLGTFFLIIISLLFIIRPETLRHPASFTKSASYLNSPFLKFTLWLLNERFISFILGLEGGFLSSIYKEALRCFICRTCFIPKNQCGLKLCLMDYWTMNGVDGDWMCHRVVDVLLLGNVSEDANIWHVVWILSNGFWWEWNHPETKLFTSILRREEI